MFLGREKEMRVLQSKYSSDSFEFGIVHGRRRVGKTTLLKQSIDREEKSIYLLAQQANEAMNLELFSKVFGTYKGYGNVVYESFNDLFQEIFQEDGLIVIIDEFTYLTDASRSIESVLQGLIDQYKDDATIKLILSGSEVGMFENHFSVNRPLFNRHTFTLHLKECDYLESSMYFPEFTNVDKIRMYSILGGLPYYLAQVDDSLSLKENIIRLIIEENARFAHEVEMLLNTELRTVREYQSVLQAIHSGSTKLSDIDSKAHIHSTDKTSKYLKRLLDLEIVEKEHRFLDTPSSKKHLYRIKNNFIAFYYSFIWRNHASRIMMEPEDFYDAFIKDALDKYVSVRFEKVCEQFLIRNFKTIKDRAPEIIGRYWYNNKKTRENIEIDVCVKAKETIYAYECKWTNRTVDQRIMDDLESKGKPIGASQFGAFSKAGFSKNLSQSDYHLIQVDDLFKAFSQ